jgi:hypothetical protein
MAEQRRLILSEVRGEILEIGIGTGVNLLYYPEHVRNITTIEPSDTMRCISWSMGSPRKKKSGNGKPS